MTWLLAKSTLQKQKVVIPSAVFGARNLLFLCLG
jgi:hypothetical protein